MTTLTIEAYDLTSEFIKEIKEDFNVIIKDDSQSPYSVVFEGSKDNLIKMYSKYWIENDAVDRELDLRNLKD